VQALISFSPFLSLVYATFQHKLGANPIQTLYFNLDDWALRFLCIGLALTPLKRLLKQSWPVHFQRMMGLFAFFYACMHFLVYIVLDLSLSWGNFIDEVPKSPYIPVGIFTFLLLIPLALTSTKAMQKRLGKRWTQLHKLVNIYFPQPRLRFSGDRSLPITALLKQLRSLLCACFSALLSPKINSL